MFLITVPYWINLLIRTVSMLFIIRDEGPINHALIGAGLISEPIRMAYTDFGIGLGLVYSYLPFMVLPIYASIERFDFRLAEAAYDLYADRWTILMKVIVPITKPGIIAGSLLVFIPSLGLVHRARSPGRRQEPDDRQPDRAAVPGLAQLAVRLGLGGHPDDHRADRAHRLRAAPRPGRGLTWRTPRKP